MTGGKDGGAVIGNPNDAKDPGPATVDKILCDLEGLILPPTDVARQARRIRAHVEALWAEVERLRNIANDGGLIDPDLLKLAGRRLSALEASMAGPRNFDPQFGEGN